MIKNEYAILIVPGLVFLVFFIKYLVHRLYICHAAKNEAARVENVNRVPGRHSLLLPTLEDIGQRRHNEAIEPRRQSPPPPNYVTARRDSMPIFYVEISDKTPPPTYDECMTGVSGTKESNSGSCL